MFSLLGGDGLRRAHGAIVDHAIAGNDAVRVANFAAGVLEGMVPDIREAAAGFAEDRFRSAGLRNPSR